MNRVTVIIIILVLISACHSGNNRYMRQLHGLDQMMDQQPKVVLDSLKKIDIKKMSPGQKAYYYLLESAATDKNLIYAEDDSTLRVAEKQFTHDEDFYNLSRTQYYLAKYMIKNDTKEKAYSYLKQAETNYNKGEQDDPHFIGLVYYQLAVIQRQTKNLSEAEIYGRQSLDKFYESRDTISAINVLRLLGQMAVKKKEFNQAEQSFNEAYALMDQVQDQQEIKFILAKAALLNVISINHRFQGDLSRALFYGKESLNLIESTENDIPSSYYHSILMIFQKQGEKDSVRYYCHKLMESAKASNKLVNLINAYDTLAEYKEKEGDYKEASRLKDSFNKLKDSLNTTTSRSAILKLEKKYNVETSQKEKLEAENEKLWAYTASSIIAFTLLSVAYPFYNRHRKLKIKFNQLSEEVKHTEWGFLVTKEFINENNNSYNELERILNRYRVSNMNNELYQRFQEAFVYQKANYSERIFSRLTDFDASFINKFRKKFPELNSEELLIAAMIRHQWKIMDMSMLFHLSVDAMRKRKARLGIKISHKLKKKVDLEEYLSKL